MTPAQFRRRLGISRRTLQRWQADGLIAPAFRTLRGHGRYTEDEVAQARRLGDAAERSA